LLSEAIKDEKLSGETRIEEVNFALDEVIVSAAVALNKGKYTSIQFITYKTTFSPPISKPKSV
jgi:hypothetical protein